MCQVRLPGGEVPQSQPAGQAPDAKPHGNCTVLYGLLILLFNCEFIKFNQ